MYQHQEANSVEYFHVDVEVITLSPIHEVAF